MHEFVRFISKHGAEVLFGAVLAQQLGLPIPSAIVLLAGGAAARDGGINFLAAIALTVLAALMGDLLWYEIGARRGRSVLSLLCRLSLEPDSCVRSTEEIYGRYGMRALVVSKFVPGLSTVAAPLAGVVGVSRGRFLLYDTVGAFAYCAALLAGGWVFAAELERAVDAARGTTALMLLLLGCVAAIYILYKYVARRRFYRDLRVARISAEELRERLDQGETPFIVDLRHASEWSAGSIPGALRLRPADLDSALDNIAGMREVVLYCS